MAIYTASFSAVAVTLAQDLFCLTAPSGGKVAIREARVGQYSDFGDAAAEILSIQLIRASTVTSSGGATSTGVNVKGHTGAPTAASSVTTNSTTVALGGVTVLSDVFNVAAGWWYYPPEEERITIPESGRLVVRITAPADTLTMNGTIVFEEIGQ